MTSIINIDEELAKMLFEEEEKRAPAKAQKSAEAYETFCKQMLAKKQNEKQVREQNEKKVREDNEVKKQSQKKWWLSFFKMTPIRRNINIENISTNNLRETLL